MSSVISISRLTRKRSVDILEAQRQFQTEGGLEHTTTAANIPPVPPVPADMAARVAYADKLVAEKSHKAQSHSSMPSTETSNTAVTVSSSASSSAETQAQRSSMPPKGTRIMRLFSRQKLASGEEEAEGAATPNEVAKKRMSPRNELMPPRGEGSRPKEIFAGDVQTASECETISKKSSACGDPNPYIRPLLSQPQPRDELAHGIKVVERNKLLDSSRPSVFADARRKAREALSQSSRPAIIPAPGRDSPNAEVIPWLRSISDLQKPESYTEVLRSREAQAKEAAAEPKNVPEWGHYIQCYSDGQFNISWPPIPPPRSANFSFLHSPVPLDERKRVVAAGELRIDWPAWAEDNFRRLIRIAQCVFESTNASISYVNDVEEVMIAESGYNVLTIPRNTSLGGHVIGSFEPMVVLDTHKDWRFAGNPLMGKNGSIAIGFYAGAPLVTRDGKIVGVMAIHDPKPRSEFSVNLRCKLNDFARVAMVDIDLAIEAYQEIQKRESCESRGDSPVWDPEVCVPKKRRHVSTRAKRQAKLFFEGFQQEARRRGHSISSSESDDKALWDSVDGGSECSEPEPPAAMVQAGHDCNVGTVKATSGMDDDDDDADDDVEHLDLTVPSRVSDSRWSPFKDHIYIIQDSEDEGPSARDGTIDPRHPDKGPGQHDKSHKYMMPTAVDEAKGPEAAYKAAYPLPLHPEHIEISSKAVTEALNRKLRSLPPPMRRKLCSPRRQTPIGLEPLLYPVIRPIITPQLKLLAQTLQFDLMYIVCIKPSTINLENSKTGVAKVKKLRLLASHGFPDAPPVMDKKFHLMALNRPRGIKLLHTELDESQILHHGYKVGTLLPLLRIKDDRVLAPTDISRDKPEDVDSFTPIETDEGIVGGAVLGAFKTDVRSDLKEEEIFKLKEYSAPLIHMLGSTTLLSSEGSSPSTLPNTLRSEVPSISRGDNTKVQKEAAN
ncbi:MAG: hypothetical protein M1825_002362 [Sarcosagium campestre]|nr:MAG: hypothetical protein M1825_002362 [Sarcosagium campestre]